MIKSILYIVCTFLVAFGLSGINYNGFFKSGKVLEARVFVMSISFAIGYLLTQFIIDFLNL